MHGRSDRKLIDRMTGGALVAISCLALIALCAAPNWAQSTQSSPKPAHAAASAANAPVARAKSNGGNHEGITVHGWWTIEVKNPDGKVVAHREFENKLIGAPILSDLLLGSAVPGGWDIFLGPGDSGQFPLTIVTPTVVSGASLCSIAAVSCSATLVSAPSVGGFTLSGQFVNIPQGTAGSIINVSTDVYVCGNGANFLPTASPFSNVPVPITPSACVSPTNAVSNGILSLTILSAGANYKVGDIVTVAGGSGTGTAEIIATDVNGGATQAAVLTPGSGYAAGVVGVASGGAGFGLVFNVVPFSEPTTPVAYEFTGTPIAAIPVAVGQTIAASVQISFQ